ncbi:MAG: T9SS type A sorting domain-containing protein [Flavobacteriales bacterium]
MDANHQVSTSSSAVVQWNDRSGNANHAAQGVAAHRPQLVGSVINGYPGVLFDNDQTNYDFLTVPDNSTLEGMTGLTAFVVYQLLPGTATSAPRCFFGKRDGVDLREAYDWFLWGGSGAGPMRQQLDIENTNNRIASTSTYTTGTTYINAFAYHGTAPSDANDQILYDGNTAVGNGAETATSIANYTSDLYIGILRGHTGTGGNVSRFNGYMSEIILFNQTLNTVQRTIVNTYLAAKYGIGLASGDLYTMDSGPNGNFDHEMSGIGRNGTEIVDGSRGTSIVTMTSSSGSITTNTYLFWGHDNGTLGSWGVTDMHSSLQGRLGRVWRVSEVNGAGAAANVGDVNITFDLNGLGPVTASDLRLVVDINEDGVMDNDTPISGAADLGGGRFRFSNVSAIANGRRFTIGTTNSTRTPLPVELLSFDAEPEAQGARLSWSTASEQNSAYFLVQRSVDLVEWSGVTTVPAAGQSNTLLTYEAFDPLPRTSLTYYRLQQVDLDASVHHSHVVSLGADAPADVVLWPNPTSDLLHIASGNDPIAQVIVMDMQGRMVLQRSTWHGSEATLELSALRAGTYLLQVRTARGITAHRVIVPH